MGWNKQDTNKLQGRKHEMPAELRANEFLSRGRLIF